MGFCVINALVLMMTFIPRGGFAQLQLNPNPLRLTNGVTGGSVQISCGIPSGVTNSAIYGISISRYLKSAPTNLQTLARASVLVNQGQASLVANSGLTQNTATVSGSTSQKSMTLTLTQAKCEDAGIYVCFITYVGSTGDERIEVHENFTVIVPPGNITMTADPQIQDGNYIVGEPLTLSCNCMIGPYDSAEGETWRWSWQYQDYGGYNWMPYPNDKDITNEPPVKGTSSCQYHQISRLTVNLTIDDSQRTYRCVVQGTNNQGSSNAEYLLGVVAETDSITLGTGVNSGVSASTQPSSTESHAPTQASSTESGLAEMQVFPSKLRLSGTNQTVTLTCSIPSTATVQSVYAMTMSRNTSSQPSQEQVLALADAISPQSRLVSASEGGLPANSATVSGGTTQKSMQVILRQPDCKDAGVYRCVISYNNGTDAKPSAVDSSQNLTVTVPPSNITMSVSPDNEINVANTTVELLCNAIIGINIQGVKWIWEYNDKIDGWRTYTQDSDIRMDTPTLVPGTCYYRQVCYLTLVLALADSEREYKCTVENDGDKDSASLTLGIVNEDGNAPIQTSSTQSHTLPPASPTENYSSTAGAISDNKVLCLVTSVCLMVLIQTGP